MVFIHPERVLREAHGVHCGEAPRAAASFNQSVQRTAASLHAEWRCGGPGWLDPVADLPYQAASPPASRTPAQLACPADQVDELGAVAFRIRSQSALGHVQYGVPIQRSLVG